MGGSQITVELLSWRHRVVGISRSPGRIGSHSLYEPRSVDLENASVDDIATTLKGLDVLICAFGPHSHEEIRPQWPNRRYVVVPILVSKVTR